MRNVACYAHPFVDCHQPYFYFVAPHTSIITIDTLFPFIFHLHKINLDDANPAKS
jgi:hypothetical protein